MSANKVQADKSLIAFVSDYLPRCCGIATFTHDLCEAVAKQAGDDHEVFAVAMNDVLEGYPYPERVRFEVRQAIQADYRLASEFLNVNRVSVVCLQHEYGIFGGSSGAHILALLRRLRRPLVTTFHTILKDPRDEQRLVLQEIGRLSQRLVVMSDLAQNMLQEIYDIPAEKVVMIPHGIPDVPFIDPSFYKDQFGVEGRKVLFTFGLLSPGKGIEYAIEALPRVIEKHPDVMYISLGATHPHVKRESGEAYRNGLTRRVHELGISDNVMFVNRFVELGELCKFLGAADLYVTPYLNEAQITSGTLAYAMGTGKAVVSTPYWYATEMLAGGRGRLVDFRDADAMATEIIDLLDHPTKRDAMRKKCYTFCRKMVWKRVAQSYLDVFQAARDSWVEQHHKVGHAVAKERRPRKLDELPEVDLRHLRTLTDDTGILHHSWYCTPSRQHGYKVDDNARGLIVTAMHWDQYQDRSVVPLMHTYLSFLAHAMDSRKGRFKDFMSYDRRWSKGIGSEDSHARALWGLGVSVALCPYESMIALATRLFIEGLDAVADFSSPRAWALAITGMHAYLRRFGGDSKVRRYRKLLTDRLVEQFTTSMSDDWPWCEDVVTYSNAKLPHALLMSGKWMNRGDIIDVGKRSLAWLIEIQTNPDGMLSIIGTEGWYVRGSEKARHDQQPIEAHALIDACIEAYHVTREQWWLDQATKAFHWFLGDNDLRTPLYDFTTGGTCDGLQADSVNENQGAESTLAWLMSLLLMHDLEMEQTLADVPADKALEPRPVAKAIPASGPVVVGARARKDVSPDRDDK